MQTIELKATMDEDQRIVLNLPGDMQGGKLIIEVKSPASVNILSSASSKSNLDQALDDIIAAYRQQGKDDEWIKARLNGIISRKLFVDTFVDALVKAGLVDLDDEYPDALEVSAEELERLGKVFSGDRPMSELIDEDREEHS